MNQFSDKLRVKAEDAIGLADDQGFYALLLDCSTRNMEVMNEICRRWNAVNAVCNWQYDESHDKWDTNCGEGFQLMCDGPKENKMKFCPYCGLKLNQVAATQEEPS